MTVLLLLAGAAAYAGGVAALGRRGVRWPAGRSATAAGGLLALAVASSPPVSTHDEQFPVHVAQHLLLAGVAPLLLVLAAPVSLALRVLPAPRARLLARALRSRVVTLLTSAPVVLVLQVGGLYALYLTPLYGLTEDRPWLHALVHAHMLAAGLLFSWYLVGVDPRPHRPALGARLAVLVLAAGAHDTLAKVLYAHQLPADAGAAASIHQGAELLYYGGDAVELALAVVLLAQWYVRTGRRRTPIAVAPTA